MKPTLKSLNLSTETLRTLTDVHQNQVQGGVYRSYNTCDSQCPSTGTWSYVNTRPMECC